MLYSYRPQVVYVEVHFPLRIELKLALMKFISNAISVANVSQEAKVWT